MLRLMNPLRIAFAGTFAARLAGPVQAHLGIPCDVIVDDESEIASRLSEVDVLVTLAFTREMGRAARRLKLVQVPGAGLDRIDRSALPRGTWLANAYGHEVGTAEYGLAATLTLTRGLLGEPKLRVMKRTAVLVNVSRAEIVDEDALYEALADQRIGGAVLDVWYRYPSGPGPTPPARRAFHELPNVLMTPHVSGWTDGMLRARAKLIAENIHRAARGEPPVNLIPSSE